LSRQQVQSALGFPVKPAARATGDCIYDFSNRDGEINFGIDVSSRDKVRADFNATETSDEGVSGLALRHLTGIGQDAFLLVAKGQAAAVEVLSGDTEFVLQVYWAEAPQKQDIAISLASEAIARLHAAS
jgi:hypothetical protein